MTDTDEKIDENSPDSILDVFSAEFETPEPSKEEEKKEEAQEVKSSEPAKTEEPADGGSEGNAGGEETGQEIAKSNETSSQTQETSEKKPETGKDVPSSDQLLAEAMKAISALSQQKTAEKKEPSQPNEAEKAEEDADTKVFTPKKFDEYTFNISPKLYNGLFNSEATEEDRITCLQAYAAGIATTVHNKIVSELGGWVKNQFAAVPGAINYLIEARERNLSTQKSLREDFYSSYPELKKPELLPLIKATIEAVQKETGAKAWDKNFKTLVGTRVKTVLSAYAQAGKPAPVAPKTVAPAASPAPAKTGSSDPNSSEAIFDLFNSEF